VPDQATQHEPSAFKPGLHLPRATPCRPPTRPRSSPVQCGMAGCSLCHGLQEIQLQPPVVARPRLQLKQWVQQLRKNLAGQVLVEGQVELQAGQAGQCLTTVRYLSLARQARL
jgi:hypothetical protein